MRNFIGISVTILIAIFFTLMPVPSWAEHLRPDFVELVILYWAFSAPSSMRVGGAWCLGLMLDILKGGVLGQHALSLVIVTYFMLKFHPRMRQFPIWQQSLAVAFLLLAYHCLQIWSNALLGELSNLSLWWLPVISSAILWPWMCAMLRAYQRRYYIT